MIHISDLIPKFYTRPRLEDPTAHAICTGPGKSLAIKECLAQLRARGIPAIVYDYDHLLSRDAFHATTDVVLDVDSTVEQFQLIERFLASRSPGFLFVSHPMVDSVDGDEAAKLHRSANRLVDLAIAAVHASTTRDRPIALVLDQLPVLGTLQNLPAAMVARKSGVVWAVPSQAWQQVEEKYGAGVAHRMRANLRFAALGDL